MAWTVSCPKCAKRYRLPDGTRSGRVECKSCGAAFKVRAPGAVPASAPPAQVGPSAPTPEDLARAADPDAPRAAVVLQPPRPNREASLSSVIITETNSSSGTMAPVLDEPSGTSLPTPAPPPAADPAPAKPAPAKPAPAEPAPAEPAPAKPTPKPVAARQAPPAAIPAPRPGRAAAPPRPPATPTDTPSEIIPFAESDSQPPSVTRIDPYFDEIEQVSDTAGPFPSPSALGFNGAGVPSGSGAPSGAADADAGYGDSRSHWFGARSGGSASPSPMRSPMPPAASPAGSPAPSPHMSAAPLGGDAPPLAGGPSRPVPRVGGGDPLIGLTLGGCTILSRLGGGGMGTVYEARQLSLDRSVAVKVLPEVFNNDADYLVRFTREALAAARLDHHNIVQVFDVGCAEGVNFFSMELVRGESLAQILKKRGKIPAGQAAGWIVQAARGLQYAHERGIVHRDVKPANLMLNEQGLIKVADLGLAKQSGVQEDGPKPRNTLPTAGSSGADPFASLAGGGPGVTGAGVTGAGVTGLGPTGVTAGMRSAVPSMTGSLLTAELTIADVALGSLGYMAPEQMADARSVDGRADVYSLGCTFFQLVTGRLPYPGRSIRDVAAKQAKGPPPTAHGVESSVPEEISELIARMLARNPADRFQTMGEVAAAIEATQVRRERAALTEAQASALESAATQYVRAGRPPMRRFGLIALVGVCIGVAGAGLLTARFSLLAGAVAFALVTALTAGLVRGCAEGSYLFGRVRRHIWGWGPGDWLTTGTAVLVGAAAVHLLGMTVPLLVGGAAGVAAGFAWYRVVRAGVSAARTPFLESATAVVRMLRLAGWSEDEIRDAVVRFAGRDWEPLFEALFGQPALAALRRKLEAEGGGGMLAPARLRDRLIEWFDAREAARLDDVRQRLLAEAEARANAQVRDPEDAKVREQRRKDEAVAMQKAAALAAMAGASGDDDATRRDDLRAAMALATGMAPAAGGKELAKIEPRSAPRPNPVVDLLLAVPRLLINRWAIPLAGCAVLAAAFGVNAAQAAEAGADPIALGLRGFRDGIAVPTANALVCGGAMLLVGLLGSRPARLILTLGALAAGPAALFWRDRPPIDLPLHAPASLHRMLLLDLPVHGEPLFWAGGMAAVIGVIVWCLTPD
jgi:serine/threonine protein kinase